MALARAIVNKPEVLLLDEPLGALDLKLREQMQEELKALQKTLGITFIFVTHDQGEALSMADRVAVFNAGKIMQVGTPEDIYRRPQTALCRRFRRLVQRAAARSSCSRCSAIAQWASLRPEAVQVSKAGGRGFSAYRHGDFAQLHGLDHPPRHRSGPAAHQCRRALDRRRAGGRRPRHRRLCAGTPCT